MFAAAERVPPSIVGKARRDSLSKRVFLSTKRVGLNGGVVGYFGLARVANEDMDQWLRRALDHWDGSRVVADLGDYLRAALNSAVPRAVRRRYPSGFPIGCFSSRATA